MKKIDNSIFSIDENRIWVEKNNNHYIFNKKTTKDEVDNIKIFKEILTQYKKINIDDNIYNIVIPEIYSFEGNILKTVFFDGDNLETLLRTPKDHIKAVKFLNNLFKFILDIEFRWVDFAPRNILINNNEICFVDFEKKFSNSTTLNFLRNHVYEEYSSFLLEDERILSISDITNANKDELNKVIHIDEIKIKRIKFLAKLLYNKKLIMYQEYLDVIKYILNAEKPSYDNGQYFFPRLYLSTLLKDKENNENAYINYSNEIINLNKIIKKTN